MPDWTNEGLRNLDDELGRTAVISETFKKLIMGWATRAVQIAYEKGLAAGKEKEES